MGNSNSPATMSEPSASRALESWIATGSWILTPADIATTTSLAPTASAHSACATATYSIYITATSHALAALHRAAPATYSIYITATSLALASPHGIAAYTTDLYKPWQTASTARVIIGSTSTAPHRRLLLTGAAIVDATPAKVHL